MKLTERLNTLFENIFANRMEDILPKDYEKFAKNFLSLHKDNKITKDKNGFLIGFRKGKKQALWKYIPDDMQIYYDKEDDIKIMNFFDLVKKTTDLVRMSYEIN